MFPPHSYVSLFLTCVVVSTVFSQDMSDTATETTPADTSSSKIGSSACFLYGDYDLRNDCAVPPVLCDQLPSDCSAYVWFGASVSLDYDVHPTSYPVDTGYFEQLTSCAQVPVYLGYGYNSFQQWSTVLACCGNDGDNVKDEVAGLNAYLSQYGKVAGLILRNLDIYPGAISFKDFSNNLKCYIQALKDNIPGMEIGISLYADEFQMYYENPVQEWIDFQDLRSIIDFVIINFAYFNNECTRDLKNIGLAPITGDYVYTMENIVCYLNAASIPNEKVILGVGLNPVPPEQVIGFSRCNVTTATMCQDPKSSSEWCAPSTETLYAKGVFVKENGMRFIATHVDLDDVNCDCQCSQPFPLFHAVLDGYNGNPCPPPCELVDRMNL